MHRGLPIDVEHSGIRCGFPQRGGFTHTAVTDIKGSHPQKHMGPPLVTTGPMEREREREKEREKDVSRLERSGKIQRLKEVSLPEEARGTLTAREGGSARQDDCSPRRGVERERERDGERERRPQAEKSAQWRSPRGNAQESCCHTYQHKGTSGPDTPISQQHRMSCEWYVGCGREREAKIGAMSVVGVCVAACLASAAHAGHCLARSGVARGWGHHGDLLGDAGVDPNRRVKIFRERKIKKQTKPKQKTATVD